MRPQQKKPDPFAESGENSLEVRPGETPDPFAESGEKSPGNRQTPVRVQTHKRGIGVHLEVHG